MTKIPFTTEDLKKAQVFLKGLEDFHNKARQHSLDIEKLHTQAKDNTYRIVFTEKLPEKELTAQTQNFLIELNTLFEKYGVEEFKYLK